MDVSFKLANLSHIVVLLGLMRELYVSEELSFEEAGARAALKKLLTDDSLGRVWLIETSGNSIGYVVLTFGFSLEFHGRDAFVDEIYIQPQHRRQGIGRAAFRIVEDACHSLSVQALHLEVGRANISAQAAYRKYGFKDRDQYLMTRQIFTTP